MTTDAKHLDVELLPVANKQPLKAGNASQSGTDYSTFENDEAVKEVDINNQVTELARQLTRNSKVYEGSDTTFTIEQGGIYDPFSETFDPVAWTRRLVHLNETNPSGYAPKRSGLSFNNLTVYGWQYASGYQHTVGNVALSILSRIKGMLTGTGKHKVAILHRFDGLLLPGELLVVLGPPGSGCSTLLKTIAGETDGIFLDPESKLNYHGITSKQIRKNFRGEAIYTAEVDVHFPNLTVGETLSFAASARASRNPPHGISKAAFAQHRRDVIMSILGISHTVNTRVGNQFVRGVSGGERKRTTIAEAMLSEAPLQCWDNSTRGLDAANAVEFCKTLSTSTKYTGSSAVVAIYQSPQTAYNYFTKVTVLYEGHQIYYGPCEEAKQFFIDMGFCCPEQQSTPDFLTALTSPSERLVREGMEHQVPRTPLEFNQRWRASQTYKQLIADIEAYNAQHTFDGPDYQQFLAARRNDQAKTTSSRSPYTLSYGQQVLLCLNRAWNRLKADPTFTLFQLMANIMATLIIASVFYNLSLTTASFFSRGGLIFFAVLMNAFASALEILTLYEQRPIVEKHERYAFYHPSAEAFSSMLMDLPYKLANCFVTNIPLYFMTNLRREPGAFFYFILVTFLATLSMSSFFRCLAAMSRSLVQALTPAAVLILIMVLYTGFALPPTYMLGWISWVKWLNPIYYAFESLMANEFSGREFLCDVFIPTGPEYDNAPDASRVCTTVGSVAGRSTVSGTTFLQLSYGYSTANRWRNIGILIAFIIGLTSVYLAASELIKAQKSKGEVAVYPRGKSPILKESDCETNGPTVVVKKGANKPANAPQANIQGSVAVFSWKDLCYDVKIKKENRRILDHVDGWVKPGTLTALMGVSGAGKTTLLDVLATRVTMGVVTGEMLIDGKQRDSSFQRKTGYCQQQDVHLATSTVREALEFSALLRQPAKYTHQEKLDYVDEVLVMLEMESYQDAVVGNLGEGLNVEQRKRLTIGVELVARPELLFFVDEPTSGLDSQTSWSILSLLEKLSQSGQAVLCTIHQPSAMLFSRFDRLLFLAKGGKTVYFEEIGQNSEKLISYFERNGGPKYKVGENPAEWMLEVIGAAPGSHTDIDWHKTWLDSPEYGAVRLELERLKAQPHKEKELDTDLTAYNEFAAPLSVQFKLVFKRVLQQLWRNPTYIYSKMALVGCVGLIIGFSLFKVKISLQGIQVQLMAIFLILTIFGQIVQQIGPEFMIQRDVYEVKEKPAKTYSWKIFMLSNILAEIPWNSLAAAVLFFCWYYPVGLYSNAVITDSVHERGAQMFLMVWAFLMFSSTAAHFALAAAPTAEAGMGIANLIFSMSLIFNGVLVVKANMGWWIWMYWLSPFHYLVEGMLTTGIARTPIRCSDVEFVVLQPPSSQTCQQYLAPYMNSVGGYLQVPDAVSDCHYCPMTDTDTFLAGSAMYYSHAWRNFGILMIYCIFNAFAALGMYYLARVPKNAIIEAKAADDVKSIADVSDEK